MHFADVNTFMVQQIIKFTKDLPLFRYVTPPRAFQEEIALVNYNPTPLKKKVTSQTNPSLSPLK